MKILIVEDNQFYGDLVKHYLQKHGFTDITILNSWDNTVEMESWDLAILDFNLNMGDFTGESVKEELRRSNPKLPVVFLTAQENIYVTINLIRDQRIQYVSKSNHSFETLLDIIYMYQLEKSGEQKKRKRRYLQLGIYLTGVAWAIFYVINTLNS